MNCSLFRRAAAAIAAALIAALALDAAAQAPAPAAPARPASTELGVPLERVVAIINDEALTQHELAEQKRIVLQQMKAQNITPPAIGSSPSAR